MYRMYVMYVLETYSCHQKISIEATSFVRNELLQLSAYERGVRFWNDQFYSSKTYNTIR